MLAAMVNRKGWQGGRVGAGDRLVVKLAGSDLKFVEILAEMSEVKKGNERDSNSKIPVQSVVAFEELERRL
jgi:hypothetical protein